MEFWPQNTVVALIALKYIGHMWRVYTDMNNNTAKMVGGFFGTTIYYSFFLWLLYIGGFWK
jgi:hypothetical protein